MLRLARLLPVFSLLLLASCGGGGGGGGSGGGAGIPLTFSGALTASFPQGEPVAARVNATPNTAILNGDLYAYVLDTHGVVTADVTIGDNGNGTYLVTFSPSPVLAPGHYTGSLTIVLCRTANCSSQYQGSPVALPYNFTVTAAVPAMSLQTAPAFNTPVQDEASSLYATIQVDSRFDGPHYFSVRDVALNQNISVASQPTGIFNQYRLTFALPAGRTPGLYNDNLTVWLCYDANPCSGSTARATLPLTVPYSVRVLAANQRPTLNPPAAAGDWVTFQGNAAHTGYVPVTVAPAALSLRWRWAGQNKDITGISSARGVVTGGGLAYVASPGTYAGYNSRLYALNETDGSQAWQADLGAAYSTNPPTLDGGNVYIGNELVSGGTRLWSLAASNGAVNYSVSNDAGKANSLPLTPKTGSLYRYDSWVYAINAATGSGLWAQSAGSRPYSTPATDGSYVYTVAGNIFRVMNAATGNVAFTVDTPAFATDNDVNMAPVLAAPDTVVAVNGAGYNGWINFPSSFANALAGFSINNQAVSWSVSGGFVRNPAVHDGVLYTFNSQNMHLEARSVADGSLLWFYAHGNDPIGVGGYVGAHNIVVTDNVVFVATDDRTIGIDLTTHLPVFNYAKGGALAISRNGLLYIHQPSDHLSVFNLH